MEVVTAILLIIGCLGLIFIVPFLSFIIGLIIGWLIKISFGAMFISGLKLIGLDIPIESIPLLCGVLNVIGSFFRSRNFITKDKKEK